MISSISLSTLVGGLGVQSRVVETAAANIANATTGNYESARGLERDDIRLAHSRHDLMSESPSNLLMRDGFSFSGESQRDSTSKHPALVVSKPLQGAAYIPLPPEGEVDLGREVINLTQAKHVYAAMARVYSSIVETEKKGLDALA